MRIRLAALAAIDRNSYQTKDDVIFLTTKVRLVLESSQPPANWIREYFSLFFSQDVKSRRV